MVVVFFVFEVIICYSEIYRSVHYEPNEIVDLSVFFCPLWKALKCFYANDLHVTFKLLYKKEIQKLSNSET